MYAPELPWVCAECDRSFGISANTAESRIPCPHCREEVEFSREELAWLLKDWLANFGPSGYAGL